MTQFLCIVAGQRAGTTALQAALGSTGRFYNFREVFHTEPPQLTGTFLEYSTQRDLRVADMASEIKVREIATGFMQYLLDIAHPQVPLLDIKLNSWHVIKPYWTYVHQMPFFMGELSRSGAVFLFVRRRDIVEQVVSEQIARSTEKWHGLQEGDVTEQLHINVARVAEQARLIRQSETFLLGCLEGRSRLIAIDYEDLYPDGFVNPRLLLELQEKLGIALPLELKPSIKKNVPDKRNVVDNYDEVSHAIQETLKRFPTRKLADQIT